MARKKSIFSTFTKLAIVHFFCFYVWFIAPNLSFLSWIRDFFSADLSLLISSIFMLPLTWLWIPDFFWQVYPVEFKIVPYVIFFYWAFLNSYFISFVALSLYQRFIVTHFNYKKQAKDAIQKSE